MSQYKKAGGSRSQTKESGGSSKLEFRPFQQPQPHHCQMLYFKCHRSKRGTDLACVGTGMTSADNPLSWPQTNVPKFEQICESFEADLMVGGVKLLLILFERSG